MDLATVRAQGMFAAFVATLFERAGVISVEEFGRMLGIYGFVASEAPSAERDILELWASMVLDFATDGRVEPPSREGDSQSEDF